MTREGSTDLLLVQVMLRSAQKLLAALRTEPPDAEDRGRAADVLRLSFAPIWRRVPFIELTVTDQAVLWNGNPVLETADDREGLIAALRGGGVTGLTLVPGVESSEIHELLLAVHRARGHRGPEADLPTLLFRADLRLLRYSIEDGEGISAEQALRIGASPPAPSSGSAAPTRESDAIREAVREDAAEEQRRRAIVQLEQYDSTLYFLDEREIEYLKSAIDREYTQDHAKNALALLLDTLQLRPDQDVRREVVEILADLLPHLLSEGRFDAVAYLVGEVRRVGHDAPDLRPEQKEALDRLRASVSEPRAVVQLFHALDGGGVRTTAESMGVLLRELRPQAIRQVLGWSELLGSPEAKRAVSAALEAFFSEWPHALSRMLDAEEREVVHAALGLAVRLKLPGFVDPLAEIAGHPDASTRALVARALAAIGNAAAFRRLLAMANDEDQSVRFEVWRTFASRPYRGALRTIEAAINGKDVEGLGRREKRALFEAYGTVAGAEAVDTLTDILQGKGPSGVRASAHTRACAAVGLGIVGTPHARRELERAAKDRDPVVRAAASEALREDRSA
jgi:hypothetical protein